MRLRDAPVGYSRSPHREIGDEARIEIESLVAELDGDVF
jgi:hypothetical protein